MIQSTKLSLALFLTGAFFLFHARDLVAKATWENPPMHRTNQTGFDARWHTIKVKPLPSAPNIHFYDKLNPIWWFKNSDDPKPPVWYRPDDKHRRMKWSFRNPLHNFHFYVAGVADKEFSRSGKFPGLNSDPRGGWDFEAARYKFIWLPFVSYHRPKFDFYFGWRNRGNFGIKININPAKGKSQSTATTVPADQEKIPASK